MKKFIDIICINVLTLLIGLLSYYTLGKKTEVLTAIIVAGVSISYGVRQLKIENDKIFKELFTYYNKKYDEKFNDELSRIEQKTILNKDYELTEIETKLIIDYLNLCAEEYLWFQKGRIDNSVWLAWENGMKYYLKIEPIKKCFEKEKAQKNSYYGLFEKLKIN